jgi:RNA polymerase sigma-70 factor (ECF subfamily)
VPEKDSPVMVEICRSRLTPILFSQVVKVNGQPGVVNIVDEKPHSTFSFEFVGDTIQSIILNHVPTLNPVGGES